MKKYNWIILFGLIVVLVVVSGCTQKIEACESQSTYDRDGCYLNEAVFKNDQSFCNNIVSDSTKNICNKAFDPQERAISEKEKQLKEEAYNKTLAECNIKKADIKSQLISQCSSCNPDLYVSSDCVIGKSNTIEDCKSLSEYSKPLKDVDSCLSTLAEKFKDTKFCDALSSGSEKCYLDLALSSDNPRICNGLNQTTKINCFQYFLERRLKTCGDATKNEFLIRESCIINELKIDLPTGLDDKITTCLNLFEKVLIMTGGNPNIQEYQPKIERQDCIAIIGINKDDLSICDQAREKKKSCYNFVAKSTIDCDKLGADYQGCYANLAIKNSDPSLCNQLADYGKYNCIQNIALETNDISLCTQLVDGDGVGKTYCANTIYNNIKGNLTVQICDAGLLSGSNWAEECYFTIAKKTLDISLCDKSGQYKTECQTVVGHAKK